MHGNQIKKRKTSLALQLNNKTSRIYVLKMLIKVGHFSFHTLTFTVNGFLNMQLKISMSPIKSSQ